MLHKQFSKPARKALAAGLMAAWLSTGAIADDGGARQANDAGFQPVSTPAVQQEKAVPVIDFGEVPDTRSALMVLGVKTNEQNGMILVYSGNNQDVIDMLQKGAGIARARGSRIMGVAVIGEYPDIGHDKIALMVNGSITETRDPLEDKVTFMTVADYIDLTQEQLLIPMVRQERERENQRLDLSQK